MSKLKEHFKKISKMVPGSNLCNDNYNNIYDFAIKEFSVFDVNNATYTEEGEIKECFCNALHLCLRKPEYVYTEGYILTFGIPVLHAWVTDNNDNIIDPTLRNVEDKRIEEYYGVRFNNKYVLGVTEKNGHYTSMIDNYYNGFPILTGEHKKEQWKY